MKIQSATYQTVIVHDFKRPAWPPQSAPVPYNAAAAEVSRYIPNHASQVDQWRQAVNAEDILKKQFIESLDEKYFKGPRQAYINYANHTLVGLLQHLYYDHETISPIDIEYSEHKMKKEWLLLDPMVDLFETIEEVVEFAKSSNTPIPGGKVVNITYLMIIRTVGMEKFCEQLEDMQVGQKTWQAFKESFSQACSHCQFRKKTTAASHGYG